MGESSVSSSSRRRRNRRAVAALVVVSAKRRTPAGQENAVKKLRKHHTQTNKQTNTQTNKHTHTHRHAHKQSFKLESWHSARHLQALYMGKRPAMTAASVVEEREAPPQKPPRVGECCVSSALSHCRLQRACRSTTIGVSDAAPEFNRRKEKLQNLELKTFSFQGLR